MLSSNHETIEMRAAYSPVEIKTIHRTLLLKFGLLNESDVVYSLCQPKSVLNKRIHYLYWERSVLSDRTIKPNLPDIIIVEEARSAAWLLDIDTQHSYRKGVNRAKKIWKLALEIRQAWQQSETNVVSLIMSTTSVVQLACRTI